MTWRETFARPWVMVKECADEGGALDEGEAASVYLNGSGGAASPVVPLLGRGLHSFTFQLSLSRV
jgi:hypothetical protein